MPCTTSAKRQQDREHGSACQTAIGNVEVREVLQVNKVDDGAAADAGYSHQAVAQVPDGSCEQQAECNRPADRAQPGHFGDDQHRDCHRHTG